MDKKSLLKSNKGITLMVLIITLVIMLILMVTITVNIDGYAQRKRFAELETDITKLKEEVDLYYSKYKELPIANKYINTEALAKIEVSEQKSVNDNENYYVIDLDLLDDMELNNGKDFETIEDKNTDITDLTDIYIINEQSHIIYYPNGRYFNGEFWYTTLGVDSNDIELIKTKATITFDSNGGTGTMENQTVMTGRVVSLNENKFTAQTGYKFDGWNTKADGTGTSFQDNDNITLNEDVTLYAQWIVNKLYLYYYGNEYSDITGGWTYEVEEANGRAAKNPDNLYLGYESSWMSSGSIFTTGKEVDLTNYSKMYFTLQFTSWEQGNSNHYEKLETHTLEKGTSNYIQRDSIFPIDTSVKTEYIYTSDIEGQQTIRLRTYSSCVKIYAIWLE